MPKGVKGSYQRYNCKCCGKECKRQPYNRNLYCSIKCQGIYKSQLVLKKWLSNNYKNKHGKFPSAAVKYTFEKQGSKCGICGCKDWNGRPLTFQQDHIDGNVNNLKVNNLRVICPNCHSQTETFGRKNRTLHTKKDYRNTNRRRLYHDKKI